MLLMHGLLCIHKHANKAFAGVLYQFPFFFEAPKITGRRQPNTAVSVGPYLQDRISVLRSRKDSASTYKYEHSSNLLVMIIMNAIMFATLVLRFSVRH